jgi:hypothetical protein
MTKKLQSAVALWCVLSIVPSAWADSPPIPGELCMPADPDGVNLLRDAEAGRKWKEAAEACWTWQAEELQKAAVIDNQVLAMKGRIQVCEADVVAAREQAKANLEAGKQAVKAAAGPWYQPLVSAAKWIAGGLILGYVLGRTGQ